MSDFVEYDGTVLLVNRSFPVSKLIMRRGALSLDAKRSFRGGKMLLSVYGHTAKGGFGNYAERVRLEGAIVPSDTPKAEWVMQLEAMTRLVAARYQLDFHLRAKVNR